MSETAQEPREVPEGYTEVQLGPKLAVIPSDWEIEPLSDWLSSLETGGRPKTSKRSESDSVLSIGGAHISDGLFDLEDPVRISEAYYEGLNSGKIEESDILLVKDGATIGKSTYVDKVPEGRAAVNSHVYILRVSHNQYDSRFLYHFINSTTGLDQILRLTTGTAQAGLNRTFQQATKIPTPSLPEQRRIADILSTVDERIQQTDEIIETTMEVKSAVANRLFKQGIRDTEQEGVQLGPKSVSLPKGWEVTKLSNIDSPEENAVQTGPYQLGDVEFKDSGLRVYGQSNVTSDDYDSVSNHISEDLKDDFSRYEIEGGDVLLTRMGTVGDASLFPDNAQPGILSYHLLRIRPDQTSCWSPYLHHILNDGKIVMDQIKSLSHGSIMDGLNVSTIRQVRIPIPSLAEQKKIAQIIDQFDINIKQERQSKEELQELKRGLMQDLLTGKIRANTD